MDLANDGIHYFQNYYQNLLLFAVSISMIGWMISMYQQLDDSYNDDKQQHFTVKRALNVLGLIALIALFAYGIAHWLFFKRFERSKIALIFLCSNSFDFVSIFTAQKLSYANTVFLILPVFCWMPVRTLNMFRQLTKLETWAWIGGIEILVSILFTHQLKRTMWDFQLFASFCRCCHSFIVYV